MMKEKQRHATIKRVNRPGTALAICTGVLAALYTPGALAAMDVSGFFASDVTWVSILFNLTETLWKTIFAIAAAAFLIGALMFTAGFVSEENKSKGKNLMIGALVGMAVTLSAKAILNTAYFFVYGSNAAP